MATESTGTGAHRSTPVYEHKDNRSLDALARHSTGARFVVQGIW